MQTKRLFQATVLVFALSFGHAASDSAQATESGPSQFIQQLASQAIKVLSSPNGSLREREDKFRNLLRDDFAMQQIGRFVVGPYWRRMTPDQRRTYMKLFGEWVLKTSSIRLGG